MIGLENLYVGPAGWSYPDWKGRFYPSKNPRGFNELTFLAQHFDVVEINASYYFPQSPEASQKWLQNVALNPRFRFTAKLWQKFVLERSQYTSEDVRAVQKGIDVLIEAGRFAALLMQFPQSFHNNMDNRSWLFRIITTFSMYPLVVEVRHQSWDQPEILDMLKSREVAFANIDQPVVGKGLPLTQNVTSSTGYFRFHGRNTQMWFNENASRDDRYDYNYSAAELQAFIGPVRDVLKRTEKSYVIFNNHYRALALKNTYEFFFMLTGNKPGIPENTALHYPELVDIRRTDHPEQLELFQA